MSLKCAPGMMLVLSLVSFAAARHVDLRNEYTFTSVLLNDADRGYYALHWNFTEETKMIYFAVNVSTTGWIGFGLSPNGGMIDSDVVIGWVNDDGVAYFKDRYATAEAIPPIDPNQDWCLTSAEEEDGYTVLEFQRNFTTCDDRDRDITSDTARVIWSFNSNDPADDNDANLMQHSQRGSTSINLLGGNPNPNLRLLRDESYFDIAVSNVEIPPYPTVYWCASFKLPSDFASTTQFINLISPVITPHAREFVHHLLVFVCPKDLNLTDAKVGQSSTCDQFYSGSAGSCFSNFVLGGWAVGGDDYIFPEGVSYPIGGIGQEQFVVIEIHYDNPTQISGVVDSSGLRFYYNTQEPEHRAGILYLGHDVTYSMIIPPRTKQYTISAICSPDCTSQYFPEEGITLIENFFHTHLVGRSLIIRHYRYNTSTNQLVELEPVDQNNNYDFNFQQFTRLSNPRKVLPGDTLVLECTYDTTERSDVTYGGLSTHEEMCIAFPVFYPRPSGGNDLARCFSFPESSSAFTLFGSYVISNGLATAENLTNNFFSTLENLDWTRDPMLTTTLHESVMQGNVTSGCILADGERFYTPLLIPSPDVPYVAPDQCSGVPKGQLGPSCLKDGSKTDGASHLVSGSVFLLIAAVVQYFIM